MKTFVLALIGLLFLVQGNVVAQVEPSTPAAIVLWPEGAPGALGKEPKDIPTLTPYLADPAIATGAAMLVCPGGGYQMLASHEGVDYARWLNERGISAFVLKYRLAPGGYHQPRMLEDASRAERLIRYRAAEWKIDPKRIGVIGSSAGGHLAATLMTLYDAGNPDSADPIDRMSSRPDLGILCYPVVTMIGKYAHVGSRDNLLGKNPSEELMKSLSPELHVTKDTPPCFIFHGANDSTVKVQNSLEFAMALSEAHVPFELHIYEHARHGIGLGTKTSDPAKRAPWVKDCELWLREQKFGK